MAAGPTPGLAGDLPGDLTRRWSRPTGALPASVGRGRVAPPPVRCCESSARRRRAGAIWRRGGERADGVARLARGRRDSRDAACADDGTRPARAADAAL